MYKLTGCYATPIQPMLVNVLTSLQILCHKICLCTEIRNVQTYFVQKHHIWSVDPLANDRSGLFVFVHFYISVASEAMKKDLISYRNGK